MLRKHETGFYNDKKTYRWVYSGRESPVPPSNGNFTESNADLYSKISCKAQFNTSIPTPKNQRSQGVTTPSLVGCGLGTVVVTGYMATLGHL